jgi:hypothetical protein
LENLKKEKLKSNLSYINIIHNQYLLLMRKTREIF